MSYQNTRGGFSGRSPRPDGRFYQRNRHVGARKPVDDDSFGSEDRWSRGRGKHSHYVSSGSRSKHFNVKPASNYVYRPKKPPPDVSPSSLEACGNNIGQTECFEASDSIVKDDDLCSLSAQSDTEKIHQDLSGLQIGETPKKEAEEGAKSKPDFSGKVKAGPMQEESPLTVKVDSEEQAFKEEVAENSAAIGYSRHSVEGTTDKPLQGSLLRPGMVLIKNHLPISDQEQLYSVERTTDNPFDICPPKIGTPVMLKQSLLLKNKQKRNEIKLSMQGQQGRLLRHGMVLIQNYLSISEQVKIIEVCRDLGLGPGGFYQPGYRDGASLRLKMMCLGKNWDPETSKYEEFRSTDGAKPPIIPAEFCNFVSKAIQDSRAFIERNSKMRNVEAELPWMSPDICIVNFYSTTGTLGLHQDKDESRESLDKGLPVVSLSIGDSAEFLYGDQRDVDKADKVTLESGDVLIFGGKSRHVFHGVKTIIPDTAPKVLHDQTNIRRGRLNLTFRQY